MHQQRQLMLLVDGEVSRAERLAHRLASLNFDIQIADNGATALLQAHQLRPDVVVAASEMPILDGCLMLEALRKKPRTADIPVILLTDGNSHEDLVRGWTAGADMCIPWGHGEADVLATLHRALASLRAREPWRRDLALAS